MWVAEKWSRRRMGMLAGVAVGLSDEALSRIPVDWPPSPHLNDGVSAQTEGGRAWASWEDEESGGIPSLHHGTFGVLHRLTKG